MALIHHTPLQRFTRPSAVVRRRRAGAGPAAAEPSAVPAVKAAPAVPPPTTRAATPTPRVVPGTRTPAGLPREVVVDEHGRARRPVLLAAIMIRRGRSVAEISAATGLSAEVVTCLSRSV